MIPLGASAADGKTGGQIYNIGGKKLMKKLLSVLLAMCMVLGFMPTVTFAEDDHTHCVCGGENSVGDHTTHTAVTWTGISDLREITTPGNYFLRNDVTLSNTWTCYFDGVNLCLNGKAITGAKDKEAIYINSGASLTVTDCTADSSKVGKIAHNSGEYGGGVVNDGTLTLYNGSIADNLGFHPDPGGVNNRNTFIMNGGSIENNYSGGSGGGVYNGTDGTFTMNGGSIENNRASLCGGVGNDGTFTMNGGSIKNNDGGSASGVDNEGIFTMNGGSITDNSGLSGVYNGGTFTVSGNVNISGNFNRQGVLKNVFLYSPDGKTVTVESGKPLAATARIGITAEDPASSPTVVTGTTSVRGFYSDDTGYSLVSNGSGGLKLTADHIHCFCGNENSVGDHTAHTAVPWTGISGLSEITAEGNYYLKNDVTLSDYWDCNFDGVNLCLNGKTITSTNLGYAIRIFAGESLTITDCRETVGKITHNERDGSGIGNIGTLTLWNGSITDNVYGGGVYNEGTFTMNGGIIENNSAMFDGGGVNNLGTFTMNGGSITGSNETRRGGGVFNEGTFAMNGGSISDNYGGLGGGVYNEGTFKMSGGSISDNGAASGAGVRNHGTLTMTGGSITGNIGGYGVVIRDLGNFTVSGDVNISDNRDKYYVEKNVLFVNGNTITVEESKPLAATARIGITAMDPASYPTVVTGTTDTIGFFSDNADYMLVDNDSNGLKLTDALVTVSGVKLLNEAGGTEMAGGKTYNGKAVAYDDSAVSYTPTVSGVSLTYTWQKLNDETYSDLTTAPKAAGSYRLLVSAVKNGNTLGTQVLEFTINSYNANGSEYSTNADKHDPSGVGDYWQNVDYVVTAADGWQLSETNTAEGSWVESLTRSEETNSGSLRFYVRNKTSGIISEVITKHYNIDKTPPVISGIEDGKFYCEDVTITAEDENFKELRINNIPQGAKAVIVLLVKHLSADNKATVTALDKAGNATSVTIYYGHDWGEWVSNGDDTHARICKVNSEHTETADCHGGTATCKDRAICDDCKTAYGALEPHNNTNLQHFPAKEATKDAEGNIEYWYCDGCGRYYSDMDGTMEIQKADTVIEKLKDDSSCNLIRRIILMLVNVVIAIIIKLVIAIKNLCR